MALTIAEFGHCTVRKVLGTKEKVLRGLIFLLDGPESESEGAPSASLVSLLDVQTVCICGRQISQYLPHLCPSTFLCPAVKSLSLPLADGMTLHRGGRSAGTDVTVTAATASRGHLSKIAAGG